MKKNKKEVIEAYLKGGVTYRELAEKYGVHFGTVGKWLRGITSQEVKVSNPETAAVGVKDLQKELQAAQLRNKLLEAMLDIGVEEYGIDLRKKTWRQAVIRVEQSEPRCKAELCSLLGYSRQAYYKGLKEKEKERLVRELLIQEVLRIRQSQKQVGGRKLLLMTQPFVERHGTAMGRDKFYDVLRKNGLLIRKRRSNKPRTTWSGHWYRKYPNLIEGFVPQAAEQLWVSDITYLVIGKDFGYLSLITDAYSRKIVGFCISKNLTAKGSVKALKMALLGVIQCDKLIHHSDRGIQYCCTDYVSVLEKKHIRISMTQDGNPLHNALAERVNGILKTELLKNNYSNFKEASESVGSAINIYNNERLHSSINMFTPHQAHYLSGRIKKLWKNYYLKRKEGPVKAD